MIGVLKKCIKYIEEYLVEYLKEDNEIRGEIVDCLIIAEFELFKLIKDRPVEGLEVLEKVHRTAIKIMGLSINVLGFLKIY